MMTRGGRKWRPVPDSLFRLPYRPEWFERLRGERRLYRTELSREACGERLRALLTPQWFHWPFSDEERMRGEVDSFSFYCFPVDGGWGMIFGIPSVALYGKLDPEPDGGTRLEVRQTVPKFWFWQLLYPVAALVVTVLVLTGTWPIADDSGATVLLLTFLPFSIIVTALGVKRVLTQMEYPMFHVIVGLLDAEEIEEATFDQPFVWLDLRP
jgi:hypothetical protein